MKNKRQNNWILILLIFDSLQGLLRACFDYQAPWILQPLYKMFYKEIGKWFLFLVTAIGRLTGEGVSASQPKDVMKK